MASLRELYTAHEELVGRQFKPAKLVVAAGGTGADTKQFCAEFTGSAAAAVPPRIAAAPTTTTTTPLQDDNNTNEPSTTKRVRVEEQSTALISTTTTPSTSSTTSSSRALQVRQQTRSTTGEDEPMSQEHRAWRLYRVISAHRGVPRAVQVDPSNRFFATGGMDNVIKCFDLATGQSVLDFAGHTHSVRALSFSPRHALLFSASEDKQIKCWDLERNQQVLGMHGHTAGVYALQVHPTLDLVVSGGRDGTVRVWDMRTRTCVHVLQGHKSAVMTLGVQSEAPQISSGSEDATVRLWDLARPTGAVQTLTHHKRGVRALAVHPKEFALVTSSTSSIKKFAFPNGTLMQNFHIGDDAPPGLIHSLAIRPGGGLGELVVSGSEDGHLRFWDWKSGRLAHRLKMRTVPGSLKSESAVTALAFDMTGDRLIACVGDKSVQMFQPV